MKVKICGNKRKEDALAAVQFGADAVGFLVGQKHASDSFIDVSLAKEIVASLPPFCSSVLVTEITDVENVISIIKFTGVTTVQLHATMTAEAVQSIKRALPYLKILKTIHVIDEQTITEAALYKGIADALILDSVNIAKNQTGGTGEVHDWNISKRVVQQLSVPVILAGGLTPENVAEAIRVVQPFGVDVQSGVKGSDGYKDLEKIERFIKNAKKTSAS